MNWKDRIERAKQLGTFTKDDIDNTKNYDTSLLSELEEKYKLNFLYRYDENFELYSKQKDIRDKIRLYGYTFSYNVRNNEVEKAEKNYEIIITEYEKLKKLCDYNDVKLNWKDRIERAKNSGKFTSEDIKLADNFKTSLISELNLDIYLILDYENKDIYNERLKILNDMRDLDYDFVISVMNNWIPDAIFIYSEMQEEYKELMKTVSD